MWGGGGRLDLEFPQGTDKRLYIENAYYMDFKISSQIKDELATLLTTAEKGYKTSIHQSVMLSCSFVEVNQQNMGCTTISRSHNATKHPFLSCENSLINKFCPLNAKHGLLIKDTILIFEACGIGSDCWPRRLKSRWRKYTLDMFITTNSCFNVSYQFGPL